jgi:DNA-binding MarR family transcriptional regulator
MQFDAMVASSGRLQILTALAIEQRMEFVHLRGRTGLTDGNLCTHTRRLEAAGLVRINKMFRDRKPVTQVELTAGGRAALQNHANQLLEALHAQETVVAEVSGSLIEEPGQPSDDWID